MTEERHENLELHQYRLQAREWLAANVPLASGENPDDAQDPRLASD